MSEIESGKRAGSRDETLEKIAQALGAPLAWLVSRLASVDGRPHILPRFWAHKEVTRILTPHYL